jgi:hypothetical protein
MDEDGLCPVFPASQMEIFFDQQDDHRLGLWLSVNGVGCVRNKNNGAAKRGLRDT